MKEFSKSVNSWWSYRNTFDTKFFFWDTVYNIRLFTPKVDMCP